MKQKPKDRFWSKLSFCEKIVRFFFFEKVLNLKKNKKKISKKFEFWPEIFFAYESENSKKPEIFDF